MSGPRIFANAYNGRKNSGAIIQGAIGGASWQSSMLLLKEAKIEGSVGTCKHLAQWRDTAL